VKLDSVLDKIELPVMVNKTGFRRSSHINSAVRIFLLKNIVIQDQLQKYYFTLKFSLSTVLHFFLKSLLIKIGVGNLAIHYEFIKILPAECYL